MLLFHLFAVVLLFARYGHCGGACNGHESLCTQPFNNVTFLVTHDSYAHGPNLASTQMQSIVQQLDDGVRGLKFSAVMHNNNLHLCHTSCSILDAGPATDILNDITKWLHTHPDQVITIMWNNLYDIDISQLAAAYTASSIMPLVYTQEPGNPWPKLEEMINYNKRVVNFVDSMADASSVPWLHDQFQYIFETPYDNTDADAFNCVIDRPVNPPHPHNMMYVMNHFLYGVVHVGKDIEVPQFDKAAVTNSIKSLSKHEHDCENAFGRKPNFVEVDFYDHGQSLQFVAKLNGVPHDSITTKRPIFALPTGMPHVNDIRTRLPPMPSIPHIVIDNDGGPPSVSRNNLHVATAGTAALLALIV